MRKLVTVRTISNIEPIDGADLIEKAIVDGWNVVVEKNRFSTGENVVYVEIDSALPMTDDRFSYLGKHGVKNIDDSEYHVLKTKRLRGVYSQGLLCKLDDFTNEEIDEYESNVGIFKYEPPIPAEISGEVIGAFPEKNDFIKTDSERLQNLSQHFDLLRSISWTATEKIDGTSTSFIFDRDSTRVMGRNWEMKYSDKLSAVRYLKDNSDDIPVGYSVQGELFGKGIQTNSLDLKSVDYKVFSVFDSEFNLVSRENWPEWAKKRSVPVVNVELGNTIEETIRSVDKMKSLINPQKQAEGVVFSGPQTFAELNNRSTFKVINNAWLVKNE